MAYDAELSNLHVHKSLECDRYAKIGLFGAAPAVQGAALTAQDTTITHTAPGTADYAIQALTQTTPFGFVTANEGHTVLKVVANLQTRLAEVEARLEALGVVAAN